MLGNYHRGVWADIPAAGLGGGRGPGDGEGLGPGEDCPYSDFDYPLNSAMQSFPKQPFQGKSIDDYPRQESAKREVAGSFLLGIVQSFYDLS